MACVFVSSFFSSWLYGAAATYLEGRRTTEVLLAVLSFFLIYAGNLSRGTAALVLQAGCPPLLMPLAIGAVACPISIALYVAVDRAPPPSAADVATRSKRTAMTGAQRAAFLRRWGVFVAPQCAAYALLTGIRSVRDLYSQQIFAESLGVAEAPPYVFLIADLPGAICGGAVLLLLSRVPSNERAVFFNLGAQAASAVLLLSSTILFALKGLPGLAWQLAAGTGIFVPYLVMQTPIFERLLAVAQSEGTLSFLIFLSDGIGYVVSITLLLYRDFAPATAVAGGELALFERMAGGCAAACLVLTAVSALFFRGAIGRAKRAARTRRPTVRECELRAAIRTRYRTLECISSMLTTLLDALLTAARGRLDDAGVGRSSADERRPSGSSDRPGPPPVWCLKVRRTVPSLTEG